MDKFIAFYKRLQDAGARLAGRLQWLLIERQIEQDQEYVERFLMPHYERMIEAGVSWERADVLVQIAFKYAIYPHRLPGMLLRDLADVEIAKVKRGQIFVSPEAKQRLIEEHGLSENDFYTEESE